LEKDNRKDGGRKKVIRMGERKAGIFLEKEGGMQGK